jgi:hypothetical protein
MTKTSPSNSYYWRLSVIISLLAIGVIAIEWGLAINFDKNDFSELEGNFVNSAKEEQKATKFTILRNKAELDDAIKKAKENKCKQFEKGHEPIRVPVGFFIQSFSFLNANDVNFSGYIWMKFPKDYLEKKYAMDFVFPEEVDSNITKHELIYKKDNLTENGYYLQGWHFDVIVRETYNYSKYPLDYKTSWLRIWSKDFTNDEHILLVPDFDSYVQGKLNNLYFGLDEEIVPRGWDIKRTFYSMKEPSYDTSFGYRKAEKCRTYWELYFNIGLKRKVVDALITDLVPLFFTTILLFALLMTVSVEPVKQERFGFNTSNTIAICASLLFIVVLLHIQIRHQFAGSGLIYIEYFYIITYLMILFTTLNSYAITVKKHKTMAFLFWRDNLFPKIAYWPLLLWMMAFITLIKI